VVNFPQEWVAGFTRNQWQFCSGMGGRFGQESAIRKSLIELLMVTGLKGVKWIKQISLS